MEEEERNKHLQEVKEAEDKKLNTMLEHCGLKHIYLLVDRLFADDTDGAKLQNLPGIEHLTSSFKEQLQQLVEEVIEQGKATHKVLEDELHDAQAGLKKTRKVRDKCGSIWLQQRRDACYSTGRRQEVHSVGGCVPKGEETHAAQSRSS